MFLIFTILGALVAGLMYGWVLSTLLIGALLGFLAGLVLFLVTNSKDSRTSALDACFFIVILDGL